MLKSRPENVNNLKIVNQFPRGGETRWRLPAASLPCRWPEPDRV
jgi:hypothetical protein